MKVKIFLEKVLSPIFRNVDWVNVPTSTYVRYILAIITATNTVLNILGMNPINIDESQLYDVVSAILTVVILFVNTYKDNPTSVEAIESNKQLKKVKADKKANKKASKKV